MLKHRETYEIMRAEDVGWNANKLVLGKHSGRNAFRSRLDALGINMASKSISITPLRASRNSPTKHEIFDEDLQALVSDESVTPEMEHYRLLASRFHSRDRRDAAGQITLSVGGTETRASSDGSGPVDAAFKAIETVAKSGTELLLYSVNAITTGTDAQGEVTVRLARDGKVVNSQAPIQTSSSPPPRPTSTRSTSCTASSRSSTRRFERSANPHVIGGETLPCLASALGVLPRRRALPRIEHHGDEQQRRKHRLGQRGCPPSPGSAARTTPSVKYSSMNIEVHW